MAIRCKSCLGTYNSQLTDGYSYFHSCSPVHNPAWLAQWDFTGPGKPVAKGAINLAIPEFITVSQPRDENVKVNPVTRKTEPKDPGKGTDTI